MEKLIFAGDAQGVARYLSSTDPGEHPGHAKAVQRIAKTMDKARYAAAPASTAWRSRVTHEQSRALDVASFICGSIDEKIASCSNFLHDAGELVPLWRRFPPADAQGVVEAMLAKSVRNFNAAQELYLAGCVARPAHDNYVLGLLALPMESDRVMSVRKCIERDPGLVQDTLLKLFEIEGTSDNSLAGQDKYGQGVHSPRNTWAGLFLELCEQGAYSRPLLIEKSLAALERDWIQFRSGWFARFHGLLAPTALEMAPFAERYMGLCHSRIAPTVSLALGAMEILFAGGFIAAGDVVAALRPVLSSSVKAQVEGALGMLDLAVAKEPGLADAACSAAIPAFGHSAADVHKKVVARLRDWGMSDTARHQARDILPYVSAVNRGALATLLGDASTIETARTNISRAALPVVRPPLEPLHDSRAVDPIDSIDELVERTSCVLEDAADIDEVERVLDALMRMPPRSTEDKRRFSPLLKRARKLAPTGTFWRDQDKPVAREVARLLVFLLDGERLPPPASYAQGHFDAHAFLCARTEDLMDLAAQGQPVSPLAVPTHRRGFIDPRALIGRIRAHGQAGVKSSLQEQVLSLLRLAPTTGDDVIAMARALPQSPYTCALRYALGDLVEIGSEKALFVAAARIRHPGQDDANLIALFGELGPDGPHAARYAFTVVENKSGPYTFHRARVDATPAPREVMPDFVAIMRHPVQPGNPWDALQRKRFGGEAESLIQLSATMLPSSLEAFFAEGVRALSNNLDWWEAQWHNKAYLVPLLDPTVPFTPMAYRALACALGGKEPGQAAIAVDALIAGWTEGRLEPSVLAAVLRELMQTPLVKLARYGKSLSLATRAHEHAPQLVFDVLREAIRFDTDVPPKDTAVLLELLLTVSLELGEPLDEPSKAAIGKMKIGGKGKVAQNALLCGRA